MPEPMPGVVYWERDLPHCEECRREGDTASLFVIGAPVKCRGCGRLILSTGEAGDRRQATGERGKPWITGS